MLTISFGGIVYEKNKNYENHCISAYYGNDVKCYIFG